MADERQAKEIHEQTVKEALALEKRVDEEASRLRTLFEETYADVPEPPVRQMVERKYPEIKHGLSRWRWLKVLIPFYGIYYLIWGNQKESAMAEEKIRQSKDYQDTCRSLDQEYDAQQAENDRAYEAAKKTYESQTLPQYEAEKALWEKEHAEKLESTRRELTAGTEELAALYDSTKLIPQQYHTIEALEFIHGTLSSSSYTFRESVAMYEENRRRLTQEALLHTQETLLQEQNEMLYALGEELIRLRDSVDSMKKIAIAQGVAGVIQRHNTNKIGKGILDRLGGDR